MARGKIQRARRDERLAKALRANLKRRKTQARTREATAEEQDLAEAADDTGKDTVKSAVKQTAIKNEGKIS